MNLPPPDLPPPSLPVPEIKPPVIETEAMPLIPVNPYTPPKAELREEPDDDAKLELAVADWTGVVKEALLYPLRDDNWMGILVAGGVMLFVYLAQWVPAAGVAVFFGGSAYIASYYFEIVQHTIKGRSDMPAWPDLSCWWDDILIPGVQMLGVSLLSLLPLVLVHWLMNEDEEAGAFLFAQIGALAFAAAYFPMAALSVVCAGTLSAALPHQVLPRHSALPAGLRPLRNCFRGHGVITPNRTMAAGPCASAWFFASSARRRLRLVRSGPPHGFDLPPQFRKAAVVMV